MGIWVLILQLSKLMLTFDEFETVGRKSGLLINVALLGQLRKLGQMLAQS
jgi:hypothetical protein